ncbi:uncharacterized protein PHALS_15398 [Plasmopara halstedii]|uniref:Uncharacterized protein n=1 Tax=Plasmopara halstedii TaxID=4781 RepID=A0A0P1AG03_PLAHL|nr:uncharacterized protein PHALS_15398 [Plasmopara halstedii]CEG39686.1 hypothetical protein PHALS_15398 [Plasmopara halstedii]|eukprot:XP_024576055.1 hypothetical protein PHALS_15398 [Plasmopara halstedii]
MFSFLLCKTLSSFKKYGTWNVLATLTAPSRFRAKCHLLRDVFKKMGKWRPVIITSAEKCSEPDQLIFETVRPWHV